MVQEEVGKKHLLQPAAYTPLHMNFVENSSHQLTFHSSLENHLGLSNSLAPRREATLSPLAPCPCRVLDYAKHKNRQTNKT